MHKPNEYFIDVGNIKLAMTEWSGTGDPVLLLHATGFHSRCWDQVVKALPGRHIYAVDLRFHGSSGDAGEVDWAAMVQDLQILIEKLDLRNIIGAGHSIGGHLLARVSAAMKQRFKQLLLIDPVIFSPTRYAALAQANYQDANEHPVSRRKNRWIDADEMYERFHDRMPFCTWQDAVLRDYCDHALRAHDSKQHLQLACNPVKEAAIYIRQDGNDVIHQILCELTMPVTVMRAKAAKEGAFDLTMSPTWLELASTLPQAREIYLPEMNHFIPMQDPALVARYIEEACENQWQNH